MKLIEYESTYQKEIEDYFLTTEMSYFTSTPQENVELSLKNKHHHSVLCLDEKK
ncbi:hypothetical protein ACWN8V_11150 [Vagococcus elongatus]|uniref:hypothetical protein n=1 Tax=Vagococcus elongatus TaxID=180344 RepID=UPI001FE6B063|nr:hypothetical protein [Vagococcus elongatus]